MNSATKGCQGSEVQVPGILSKSKTSHQYARKMLRMTIGKDFFAIVNSHYRIMVKNQQGR